MENGNCLYNSAALLINSSDKTHEILRLLTSVELFEKATFYSRYPIILNQVESKSFSSLSSVFMACVSFESSDSFTELNDINISELIKKEAYNNCRNNKLASFLCLIALSTVLNKQIRSVYPEFGLEKYKKLFNVSIYPRGDHKTNKEILSILWCNTDCRSISKDKDMWSPNHFVPIVKREVLCLKKFVKSDLKRGSCSVLPSVLSHSSVTTKVLNLSCQPPKNPFSNKKSLVQSHIKFCIDNETKIVDVNIDITPNPILVNCIPCTSDQPSSLPFYDVSTYYERGRHLSAGKDDSMLLDLVNKIFIPNLSFVFPVSGEKKKRSFLHKWLLEYSWLAYSQIEDGAYCLPCTLLGSRIPNNTTIINFIQKPFKIWGNATRAYMDHNNNCRLHQMSMHCLNMLQSRSNSKKNLIEVDIDNLRKKLIISNRNKLIPIIKTIIFLGRNDIAFRGHRDDSKYHPQIGETCKDNIGIGNFVELLNFRIEAGDKVLEHHIRSAPKNATYISKTAQNKLIECCGKTIEEVLIKKIKKSGYFSILCDGASDCSNVEQLSLVIRYIDCDNVICEDFLRFIECKSGTTGLSLSQNIISAIDDLGLDIQKCRGQGYDGAGAMSGKLKGISSRIKLINSKAIFVHCACHKLNLVISKSCNVQSVRNALDQIKDISYFFNLSPKRASCLNKFIFPGQAKLIDTCRTRWVQKLKGLDVFFDNYISVFHSMEEMAYNEGKSYNIDTSSKASCFLNLMTNFSFIVSLVLTKQIMDYFYAITVVLQTKAFDISQQCNEINCLKTQILDLKKNIDVYHNEWYLIALDLAKTLDVSEVKPRLCGRQVYRDNYPSDTVSDYFKYSITSPLLDHLINELEDRFDEGEMIVYKGLSGIPATVVKKNKEKCFWKSDFMEFLHFYISDMPHPTSIHAELDLWETFWNNQSVIPSTISETLKSIDMRGFPNIREGFLIMGTIPITTCECERSISVIRRLKTYMRSRMTESRFNSLALMSIHQEIIPDVERVLNIFSVLGERRLELVFT